MLKISYIVTFFRFINFFIVFPVLLWFNFSLNETNKKLSLQNETLLSQNAEFLKILEERFTKINSLETKQVLVEESIKSDNSQFIVGVVLFIVVVVVFLYLNSRTNLGASSNSSLGSLSTTNLPNSNLEPTSDSSSGSVESGVGSSSGSVESGVGSNVSSKPSVIGSEHNSNREAAPDSYSSDGSSVSSEIIGIEPSSNDLILNAQDPRLQTLLLRMSGTDRELIELIFDVVGQKYQDKDLIMRCVEEMVKQSDRPPQKHEAIIELVSRVLNSNVPYEAVLLVLDSYATTDETALEIVELINEAVLISSEL